MSPSRSHIIQHVFAAETWLSRLLNNRPTMFVGEKCSALHTRLSLWNYCGTQGSHIQCNAYAVSLRTGKDAWNSSVSFVVGTKGFRKWSLFLAFQLETDKSWDGLEEYFLSCITRGLTVVIYFKVKSIGTPLLTLNTPSNVSATSGNISHLCKIEFYIESIRTKIKMSSGMLRRVVW
jgi:hypothetical protein